MRSLAVLQRNKADRISENMIEKSLVSVKLFTDLVGSHFALSDEMIAEMESKRILMIETLVIGTSGAKKDI